jgi:hypothetical protein
MHPMWLRWQKRCLVLASGGITLGILQGFGLINWPVFITQLLVQFFSIFARISQGLVGQYGGV